VREAFAAAAGGPVAEGAVGSGTGMICHGFKGGIGTASRVVTEGAGGHVVGVLVQANHGRRERLAVNGAPIGLAIGPAEVPTPYSHAEGTGSIIVIVATDAPLLPHQCDRLAQRAALGIARTGGLGEHTSGDLVLAFATGNAVPASPVPGVPLVRPLSMLSNRVIDAHFAATVEATEEAIVNALVAAETTTGRGATAHTLPHHRLLEVLDRHALRVL
jgi:D-aminopeptidase